MGRPWWHQRGWWNEQPCSGACCVESCYAPEHANAYRKAYGGMGPECVRAEPRNGLENEQHV